MSEEKKDAKHGWDDYALAVLALAYWEASESLIWSEWWANLMHAAAVVAIVALIAHLARKAWAWVASKAAKSLGGGGGGSDSTS